MRNRKPPIKPQPARSPHVGRPRLLVQHSPRYPPHKDVVPPSTVPLKRLPRSCDSGNRSECSSTLAWVCVSTVWDLDTSITRRPRLVVPLQTYGQILTLSPEISVHDRNKKNMRMNYKLRFSITMQTDKITRLQL